MKIQGDTVVQRSMRLTNIPLLMLSLVTSVMTITASSTASAQPTMFTVTAQQAQSHQMHPFGFVMDLANTGLIGTAFPEPGVLARFSGPPGGPLLIDMFTFGGMANPSTSERLIQNHYSFVPGFTLHGATTVTFNGESVTAREFETHQGMAHTNWCALFIQSNIARRPYGMVVAVGIGGRSANCTQILATPAIATALATFRQTH